MKKFTASILVFFAFALLSAQQVDIPVTNGDVEDNTAMFEDEDNGNNWSILGMWFNANTIPSKFDDSNSGLASGGGVDGSQALKSTIINAEDKATDFSLRVGDTDISLNGLGDYTYTFFAKSLVAPEKRPFWIVVFALDEDKVVVSNETITKFDNGGTVDFVGLENNFLQQSVTINLAANTTGKDAKYLRLVVNHGRQDNTYWFDNFTLTGPEATSTSIEGTRIESQFNVYPNPASDYIVLSNPGGIDDISICSITGSEVFYKMVNTNEYKVDLTAYPSGLYLIKTNGGENIAKFIKR